MEDLIQQTNSESVEQPKAKREVFEVMKIDRAEYNIPEGSMLFIKKAENGWIVCYTRAGRPKGWKKPKVV